VNLDLYVALRSDSRAATAAEQSILLVLAGYANENGLAWPSVPTLARDTHLAESTVRAGLRRLEEVGHVVRYQGGGNASNRYVVRPASALSDVLTPPVAGPLHHTDPSGSRRAPLRLASNTPPGAGGNEVMMKQGRYGVAADRPKPQKPEPDPPAFLQLWEAYPNGEKRKDALLAFRKLNPSPELFAEILSHVQRRARTHDWQKEGGKYVPALCVFLRGERWTDTIKGASVAVVTAPAVNAWQTACDHQPRCSSSLEHSHREQHATAVAQ
jgi:hypothetical protein